VPTLHHQDEESYGREGKENLMNLNSARILIFDEKVGLELKPVRMICEGSAIETYIL